MQVSETSKLIARHKFLWADQIYQSNMATTVEESERLRLHSDEINEIEDKLAELVPESFDDCCNLLAFVTDMDKIGGVRDDLIIDVVENVHEALRPVWRKDMEAERERGCKESIDRARRSVEIAFSVEEHFRTQGKAVA